MWKVERTAGRCGTRAVKRSIWSLSWARNRTATSAWTDLPMAERLSFASNPWTMPRSDNARVRMSAVDGAMPTSSANCLLEIRASSTKAARSRSSMASSGSKWLAGRMLFGLLLMESP